ncbi:MAG: hypothetical protein JW793_10310 [Acidobacteria bacterium]|nr:hypothetical protein [Acidobacteriota bacterium]
MKDQVWLVSPDTGKLVTPYGEHPKCRKIVAAQPFTVSMVAAVVAEDLDGIFRGDNDLLVLTRSSMGERPLVERIHFFEEEIPKGRPIRSMLADTVYLADDYNGIDKLWVEVDVLEIDTDTGERKAAVKAFQNLAAAAGAVFPALLPYAFGAGAVAGVIEKMTAALERNKHVIRIPFAMYPGAPRPGRAPLQAGTYAAFAQPQDPSGFRMHANGLLSAAGKASGTSYAVFEVAPVKQASPKFVTSQKVATLLTQMQRGNPHSALATIDFLADTLTQYGNFKKLNRYLELKSKEKPSSEEKALLAEIGKIDALKPFLPVE